MDNSNINTTAFPQQQDDTEVKKKKLVKHIIAMTIGTFLGIPLMLVGFIHFQGAVFTRASDSAPRDVVVSSTTDTTATIHWTTDQETQGTILYGTSPTELRLSAPEYQATQDHTVTIELLAPNTTYYFQIKIGDEIFINGSELWQFTTKLPGGIEPSPTPEPTLPSSTGCPVTNDCSIIQKELGKSCTSAEFIQCLKRNQPTP